MGELEAIYRKLTVAEKAWHVPGQIFWIPAYLHMPLPELKLKMDKELVIKKVKKRPALLILRERPDLRPIV